jgi:hypothetical protein
MRSRPLDVLHEVTASSSLAAVDRPANWIPLRFLTLIALLTALATPGAAQQSPVLNDHHLAVDRGIVLSANAGITGVLALARGVASGNVRSVESGLVVFATGAVAGAGFYEAKRQIGLERIAMGTALAFASASVVENVASGEHPLGYLRVGPGPFDLRVRTPLARENGPLVRIEVDPIATVGSVGLPLAGYTAGFCGFTLCFRGGAQPFDHYQNGLAVGRLIMVSTDASDIVVTHEMIHYVQAVQMGAVTPFGTTGKLGLVSQPDGYWDLRVDWLLGVTGLATLLVPYERRWTEVEAFTLQARSPGFTQGRDR